jgi:hypothetical protein
MRVGLFTYQDDSSTSAYLRTAIGRCGDTPVPLGLHSPSRGTPPQGLWLESQGSGLDALLFVDSPGPFWPVGLDELVCPSAAYLIDTHQDLGLRLAYAPFFDEIFVAQHDDVESIRDAGYPQAQWLPLAAEPTFTRDPSQHRPLDVAFVGKLGEPGTFRHRVLATIASTFTTNDIGRRYTPAEMCDLYGQAKIVINVSIGRDVNMRVFEAIISGALLVTDRVENGLDELFAENQHYVGYSSAEEACAVIARYLHDGLARTHIAADGQQHALAHHTYLHRWRTIRDRLTAPGHAVRSLATATPATRRKAYAHVCARLGRPDLVWRATRPWEPRSDSPSNLGYAMLALGRRTNRLVPFTPRAIRSRARAWRER